MRLFQCLERLNASGQYEVEYNGNWRTPTTMLQWKPEPLALLMADASLEADQISVRNQPIGVIDYGTHQEMICRDMTLAVRPAHR